jgi:hypothetical protein
MHVMGNDADTPELQKLYDDFAAASTAPLWTQRDDLMPMTPAPDAIPFVWKWDDLLNLAERSGELVPVGRGGERRAIGLANPGLPGTAYATSTLWCAIQYLGGHETAPEHRHSQNAFRFILQGEGVWTVVNGDPVAMRRGDLLITPGWHFPFPDTLTSASSNSAHPGSPTRHHPTHHATSGYGGSPVCARFPCWKTRQAHRSLLTGGSSPTRHWNSNFFWKTKDTPPQSNKATQPFGLST